MVVVVLTLVTAKVTVGVTNALTNYWIVELKDVEFLMYLFNVTFKYISAISWLSVLLLEEKGGHGENHRSKSLTNFII